MLGIRAVVVMAATELENGMEPCKEQGYKFAVPSENHFIFTCFVSALQVAAKYWLIYRVPKKLTLIGYASSLFLLWKRRISYSPIFIGIT